MLRVLVVDDSGLARQLIVEILTSDPDIEVVGQAINGLEAIEMAQKFAPDIITMDVNMPRANGIEATREIMITCPTPIVIVSSSTVITDAANTMAALEAGALTLVLKPPGPQSAKLEQSRRELLQTVKAMADVKVIGRKRKTAELKPIEINQRASVTSPKHKVIAIATSTGGPPALQTVLQRIPTNVPVPIFVVQHIASGFTDGFVNWLDKSIDLPVKLARRGETLKPGTVYIGPEGSQFGVSHSKSIILPAIGPIEGFEPLATYLFQSVAEVYGSNSIAVILTGMGNDGLAGLRGIHEAGGKVIAQDEKSSVVFGMNGCAVAAGITDAVLPIDKVAERLMKLIVGDSK